MIKKIIYVGYQPLTERIRDDFYFNNIINLGYKVEYWDLSNIFFPGICQDKLNYEYIVKYNHFSDVEKDLSMQEISSTLFVILIVYEARVVNLFRLLTKYKCYISIFARGALPLPSLSENYLIKKMYKVFNPKLLISFFRNKIAFFGKEFGFIKSYDLVFNAGKFGFCTIGIGYEIDKNKSKIVELNSFDFDRFIITKNAVNIVGKKYCVFLDDYLPFHPDFTLLKIKTVNPKEYYCSLNKFFNLIEAKYNLEVVIAAHPKSDGKIVENLFVGRSVFFNKTSELTKYAEFALAHCSTSISFSVLNKKPILFLYSDSIKTIMPDYYQFIYLFSKTLLCNLINIDRSSVDNVNIYAVDAQRYEDYKYNYLTSKESEQNLSVDIFCEYVSKSCLFMHS